MDLWTVGALEAAVECPTGSLVTEREALRAGRAFWVRDPHDRVDLLGSDALDLLQRLSATDLQGLAPGEAMRAVFTDDKGRVVDVPLVCSVEDRLSLLCGTSRAVDLRGWIERFIITEDAAAAPPADRFSLELVGRDAIEAAASAVDELTTSVDAHDLDDLLLAGDASLGPVLGYVELPRDRGDALLAILQASDLHPVGSEARRHWSIEQGRLLPGPQLVARPNPLEAGLRHLVSFTKGCYVGQEVVARLDTYEKVRRYVAVLTGSNPAPEQGSDLSVDGRTVGKVLDAMPEEAGSHALALIDTSCPTGTTLATETGPATVVSGPPPSPIPA